MTYWATRTPLMVMASRDGRLLKRGNRAGTVRR
jgi:hypothetical protein